MIADLYSAFLLGLTFSNIWICALVIFSLQTSSRKTSAGYILGRFVGIVSLVFVFHLIGEKLRISATVIDIFSGMTILIFGIYFIVKFSRSSKKVDSGRYHKHFTEKCEHDCNSCIITQKPEIYKFCESCAEDRNFCSSEDAQIEPLTRSARSIWGKNISEKDSNNGFLAGIMLGILRGTAMCGRLAILLPLTLKGSVFHSLIVGTGFALSSSIYPVIAILLGDQILKLVKYRNILIYINSAFLVLVSGYYFYHAFTY